MAAIRTWYPLDDSDIPIGTALLLLQKSFQNGQYSHLSVEILQNKMIAYDSDSKLNRLYLWSYALSQTDPDPYASAFFFLRRYHRLKVDPQENPALCLTVGAKPAADGGLNKDLLRAEIGVVCDRMRQQIPSQGPSKPPIGLELMHGGQKPNFRDPMENLAGAYNDATAAGPPLPPRLDIKGSIEVDDSAWDSSRRTLKWWNIKEKV